MTRKLSLPLFLAAVAGVFYLAAPSSMIPAPREGVVLAASNVTQGGLYSLNRDRQPDAPCPLKHTDVKAEITGFLARVNVVQEFENNSAEKIEAVYTFPLPPNAAVDNMTMNVGDRTIRGVIKKRDEAREIYERARARGHVASLLDQERPNIFTQAVANIMPGAKVKIAISYVETLKYDEGEYAFVFPMVVGPRYIPAQVNDAARITPPVTPQGTRAGHDISLEVKLDAGVPLDRIESSTHPVSTQRPGPNQAVLKLKDQSVIPNKDFVLKYDVAGRKVQDAVLTHHGANGGFFTLVIQPPERVTTEDVTPKELIFVLDTSGSMSGFPIEKAKETMRLALDGLYPRDTFNLITFSGDTHILFPQPVPATRENLRKAQDFLAERRGGGGTEMMKAIRAALDSSEERGHVRVVCFMTDGYVGNDMEIIGEVRKHQDARVFAFGIGSSVNHFLLDGIAREGRGEVEYVGLQDDGSAAARRFHERVRNPLLTDVAVDFGGLPVTDVYPKRIPDLFSAKPVVVTGRFTSPARGVIRLSGRMSGKMITREIPVELPKWQSEHDVLATLWARTRIADLMSQDYTGIQRGNMNSELRDQITQLGLNFRLMTQFTSFVAVEESFITEGGQSRRVEVPVEMPEGVSYEGVFGKQGDIAMARTMAASPVNAPFGVVGGVPGGTSGGVIGGIIGFAPQSVGIHMETTIETPNRVSRYKVDTQLSVAVKAVISGTPLTPAQQKFIRNGNAYVEVWVEEATPELREKLKQLGFEATTKPKVSNVLIGRIDVSKLDELTRLDGVRRVVPHSN
jgi:Ca-activated chloride channel family protein